MKEVTIEQYGTRRVEEEGGFHEKFASRYTSNLPDRIGSLVHGRIFYVEYKNTGQKPRVGQLRDHARRRSRGFPVYVIDSKDGVEKMIREEKRRAPLP
jgi:hypothetical protein